MIHAVAGVIQLSPTSGIFRSSSLSKLSFAVVQVVMWSGLIYISVVLVKCGRQPVCAR